MRNFISPINHPESPLSGSTIDAMIKRSKQLELDYISIADKGTLIAGLKTYMKANDSGLKPILGVELYFKDPECDIVANTPSADIKYFTIAIHARDQESYQVLVKLMSESRKEKVKINDVSYNLYNWKDLANLSKLNVTLTLTDIESMVAKHLLVGRPDLSVKYYNKLKEMFGNKFYPSIISYAHNKYWDALIEIGIGGTKVRLPIDSVVATDKFNKVKVSELTRYHRHTQINQIYIGGVGFNVKPNSRSIGDANTINVFSDIPGGDVNAKANKLILSLAMKLGDLDRTLINSYAYYATEGDKVVQDMKLGTDNRLHHNQHMRDSAEAAEYLKSIGVNENTIKSLIDNSYKWAALFDDFKLEYQYKLPDAGSDVEKQLMDIIKNVGRMKWDDERYVSQLKDEFKLLTDNGKINLIPYFLPIVDIYKYYDDNGHLTGPARGSAGGFLVSYLIGITHIDPIKYELSSSRFLTMDRVSQGNLPDIDCDLESRIPLVGKDGNEGYLFNKYGKKAAQVSTRTLLRVKSAILDANRFVNGSVEDEVASLAKSLPNTPPNTNDIEFVLGYEDDLGNHISGLIDIDPKLKKYSEERPKEWDMVIRALSLSRQNSRHACAYVISNADIEDVVPIMEVGGVNRVTQPEHKEIEWAGLIKYDFLVVKQLQDIKLAIDYINKKWLKDNQHNNPIGYYHAESDCACCAACDELTGAIKEAQNEVRYEPIDIIFDGEEKEYTCNSCHKQFGGKIKTGNFMHGDKKLYIWDLPEDQKVFNMLSRGETESVFQLHSVTATPIVMDVRPTSVVDCAVITSLGRPGPLDFIDEKTGRNMAEEYAARKRGESKSDIPILNEMLSETHSVLVFQEQITKLAKELAGMGVEDAENVRVAVGKKKKKLIDSLKPIFIEGAAKKVGEETAAQIWNMMETFASYGFNKCVSGDTVILKNKNQSKSLTVEEMYKAKNDIEWAKNNGKKSVGQKYNSYGYGKGFSKHNDTIHPNDIVDIRYEGIRDVYELTTVTGRQIKTTDNHKFPTPDGDVMLKDMKVGDLVYTKSEYKPTDTTYRYGGKGNLPQKGQQGFQKKPHSSFVLFRDRSNELKKLNNCQLCNKDISKKRKEIHHIDGDHGNQDWDNLALTCVSCHKKAHYKMGRTKYGEKGLDAATEIIKSIRYVGKEAVYDVEMAAPYHNFVVDSGIVTCNSHAVAYAAIAYACAYLKYHHPLEWWAAVLSNAPDKEINELYFKYVKELLLPPDINTSTEKMEIDYKEGKIRNKLSIISGLGNSTVDRIIEGRPYTNIDDFVAKGVCGPSMAKKLIRVRVLDSLFPPNTHLRDKFYMYDKAVSELKWKKKLADYDSQINEAAEESEKNKIMKRRQKYFDNGPKEVEYDDNLDISPKEEFVIKKTIFPTMQMDLLEILKRDSKLMISEYNKNGKKFNMVLGKNNYTGRNTEYHILSAQAFQKVDESDVNNDIYFAVPGYILKAETFSYQKGQKKALKILIDSSGYISEKVLWPDYNTGELKYPESLKKGAIAWFFYSKKTGKLYTNIQNIVVET